MSGDEHHEVVARFRAADMALNSTLEAMLDEHPDHRTERRGCGYTQATRHLAERINQPRSSVPTDDLALFAQWADAADIARIERSLANGTIHGCRGWDQHPPAALSPDTAGDPGRDLIAAEAHRQATLRSLPATLEYEESELIARMIRDVVLPIDALSAGLAEVPAWPEKLPVGSCPTAEKCFLELAHGFIPRKGRCNLIHDSRGDVVLVEKINMGDDHSCISLQPFVIHGVRIPVGSLLAVHYDADELDGEPTPGPLPGRWIPLERCAGFRLLRLTTLAVSPENRQRAFTVHFKAQQDAGLFEPDSTELEQLRAVVAAESA